MQERLGLYIQLTRLNRPIGILLLLWPTLWAIWIAGAGRPDPLVLAVFVAGVLLMRSAGCVVNDLADRKVDPHVKRTRMRPLATGAISAREALGVALVLTLAAFALVLLLNPLTIALSVVGVLLAASYPFMKRYTHLPQFYLGAAFGWAIPMAFAAQTGGIPAEAWLLFAAAVVWAAIYDTMYAMVDRDDDLKIGVKSTAVLFGRYDRAWIAVFQLVFFWLLFAIGASFGLGAVYYSGLLIAIGLAIYHQWLIRDCDRDRCFRAFLHNHWLGMVVFLGIVLDYLTRTGIGTGAGA